jgi:hypothetical protein
VCPLCIGTATWLATTSTSAGGVAAVLYRLRRKTPAGPPELTGVELGGAASRSVGAAGRAPRPYGLRNGEAR